MPDFTGLVETIKQAALDAVSATKPAAIMFGRVESSNPLQITLEQRLTLGPLQLILTRNVTNYREEITNEASGVREWVTIHSGLQPGETVVMMQAQGGQRFVVLDRVGGL